MLSIFENLLNMLVRKFAITFVLIKKTPKDYQHKIDVLWGSVVQDYLTLYLYYNLYLIFIQVETSLETHTFYILFQLLSFLYQLLN